VTNWTVSETRGEGGVPFSVDILIVDCVDWVN